MEESEKNIFIRDAMLTKFHSTIIPWYYFFFLNWGKKCNQHLLNSGSHCAAPRDHIQDWL